MSMLRANTVEDSSFKKKKKHGSCVVVLVVLPHAFSQMAVKPKNICFEVVT